MNASYVGQQHRHWDKCLAKFRFTINTVWQKSTGFTPVEIALGRNIWNFISVVIFTGLIWVKLHVLSVVGPSKYIIAVAIVNRGDTIIPWNRKWWKALPEKRKIKNPFEHGTLELGTILYLRALVHLWDQQDPHWASITLNIRPFSSCVKRKSSMTGASRLCSAGRSFSSNHSGCSGHAVKDGNAWWTKALWAYYGSIGLPRVPVGRPFTKPNVRESPICGSKAPGHDPAGVPRPEEDYFAIS